MNLTIIEKPKFKIAIVNSQEVLITDVQSALDLMATIWYEAGSYRIIINKSAIVEEFFDLKTRLAGEILQKFVNYNVKVAIVGDFTAYSSKSLRDFIYESNNGKHIFFVADENQGVEKLSID
ncbi:DUF4180 domain-containing protein [Clostridium swellfunianum]|uniref:DUF4180 domain-containing protein n=1 Tax=Clostridium swellfunianum TaxID=1367462 RepID=UPI00202DF7BE|nr:DUF4180 domain-containing protein [Clostridium swellfunianum]MCM0650993.1 DUF4180 domain-containing protein [Clostridium swellfunianum]